MPSDSVEKLQMNSPNLWDGKSHSEILSIGETGDQQKLSATNKLTNSNGKSGHGDLHQQQQEQRQFGWLGCQPRFLQTFLSAKWALFWLCWAGALQGLLVNGCINVVITTIERRFGLRSSQTGLVASGYDIASFLCLVPVTYFGGRASASKPRWIGGGMALMGIGSLVFAMPHFLVAQYRATSADINICSSNGNGNENSITTCSDNPLDGESTENLSWNVWFFFFAQLLHGAGAAPLFTLGVTYIDENVSKKMSSVYLGIYYTMTIIGPAVGYVVGGQLLLLYTDFISINPLSLGLTPQSKVWVGAWWIGFVFIAIICALLTIPLLAYPPSLPGSWELQQEKVSEAHNGSTSKKSSNPNLSKMGGITKALFALLKNPTLFFLNLAGASEGLIIAGFAAFLPKLIENQFSVTAIRSALIMGIITVPAGGGGTFLGGYLVKKFNLNCSGIIKMCLISTIIGGFFTACFFVTCPNLTFAGVTSSYFPQIFEQLPMNAVSEGSVGHSMIDFNRIEAVENRFQLDSDCNKMCSCSRQNYDPICGIDGVMYYSPCHAGCTKEISMDNSKVYLDCECILAPNRTEDPGFDAINTMCNTSCSNLWYFVSLSFFLMLFTFLATMPALSATLRCVHDDQRSFALGIQWIKVRIFGTIPAPLIFGTLIDDTCILWQESCDGAGACLVYDNYSMSKYMLSLALIGKACSVLFFFGAWWCYVPPKQAEEEEQTLQLGSTNQSENNGRF